MADDHLSTEEISALLDRGAGEASEGGHVEECPACRREMELLRRMRMALSALDDREAPPGAWASVEAELEQRDVVDEEDGAARSAAEKPSFSLGDVGWARAAAAVVLFVGGLGLGTHLASPGGGGASRVAVAGDASAEPAAASDGLTYRQARERLEELRDRGPTFEEAYRNPRVAAEHLARLDALMRASQEALREDPADPALNDFLFRVAEERESLNRALQLSSLEYR